jgi:hypothetical protein
VPYTPMPTQVYWHQSGPLWRVGLIRPNTLGCVASPRGARAAMSALNAADVSC